MTVARSRILSRSPIILSALLKSKFLAGSSPVFGRSLHDRNTRLGPDRPIRRARQSMRSQPEKRKIQAEDYPLPRQFDVVLERDEEGHSLPSAPQLSGCHTRARTLDEGRAPYSRGHRSGELEGVPERSLGWTRTVPSVLRNVAESACRKSARKTPLAYREKYLLYLISETDMSKPNDLVQGTLDLLLLKILALEALHGWASVSA